MMGAARSSRTNGEGVTTSTTAIKQHDWRQISVASIFPLGENLSDGTPAVVVIEEKGTQTYCWECLSPLDDSAVGQECLGEQE